MDNFETPQTVRLRSALQDDKPLIPESPLMRTIGYGTGQYLKHDKGASVYRLKHSPKVGMCRSPWAVKKVCRPNLAAGVRLDKYALRLKEEADILKKLNHPNIVGFRAFVKGEDGRDCLAMEECDASVGDLIGIRSEDGLGPFPAEKILKVALDISKALHYLHTECRLLHGDLKSLNVLVNGDFEVAKLCDFGASVPLKANGEMDTDTELEYVGTAPWCAPEVLCNDGLTPITAKTDIFSFGLILWEMITLRIPHFDESLIEDADESGSSASDVGYGTRPLLPESPLGDEYKPVIQLFNSCTEEDFNKRPSAKEIVEQLEKLKESQ
ncbi:lymphokine-activated killer T-cell-originated protein kinase isoform X4 [Cryptotermes secundus]|uniref:lymphokine-activated killer T-cell-originated protein kinase isoform X4 n=2 Tax=Cryptotermes secundus TaxID=105785 RepID=UPI000CD7BC1F|nr:lymphokine-activated killer T-cell-originated protein kinase isoform X4 [Cryptotermes secundus]